MAAIMIGVWEIQYEIKKTHATAHFCDRQPKQCSKQQWDLSSEHFYVLSDRNADIVE